MYVGVFKPHMNCEMCCNNDFVFVLSCTYSHSFSDWNLHEKFLWPHETSHAIYDQHDCWNKGGLRKINFKHKSAPVVDFLAIHEGGTHHYSPLLICLIQSLDLKRWEFRLVDQELMQCIWHCPLSILEDSIFHPKELYSK